MLSMKKSERRTLESIRLIRDILGPGRSLDDVLQILRQPQKGPNAVRQGGNWRVS